jgi:hypothetical protein
MDMEGKAMENGMEVVSREEMLGIARFVKAKRNWEQAHAAYQTDKITGCELSDSAVVMALVLVDAGIDPEARQFFGW